MVKSMKMFPEPNKADRGSFIQTPGGCDLDVGSVEDDACTSKRSTGWIEHGGFRWLGQERATQVVITNARDLVGK